MKSITKKFVFSMLDLKNIKLRNSEFKNYLETLNYLIKDGFNVVFFSEFDPKLNIKGFHYFDLKIDENKKKYYLIKSEIYLGQISGPFFLANFLEKNDNYRSSNFQSPIIFKKFCSYNKKVFEKWYSIKLERYL